VEDSNVTATEESTTSSEQCQIHVDYFFDTEGIVHKQFVPTGQTVNEKLYCDVLWRVRGENRRKRPEKWRINSWVLHHDKPPAHVSLIVRLFLASTKTTVNLHPP
jgi:hypothetical protein